MEREEERGGTEEVWLKGARVQSWGTMGAEG